MSSRMEFKPYALKGKSKKKRTTSEPAEEQQEKNVVKSKPWKQETPKVEYSSIRARRQRGGGGGGGAGKIKVVASDLTDWTLPVEFRVNIEVDQDDIDLDGGNLDLGNSTLVEVPATQLGGLQDVSPVDQSVKDESLEDYFLGSVGQKRKAADSAKEPFGDSILNEVLHKLDTRYQEESRQQDVEMFQCNSCPFETNSYIGIRKHQSLAHSKIKDKNLPFRCEVCLDCFASVPQLLAHKTDAHAEMAEKVQKAELVNRQKQVQRQLDQRTSKIAADEAKKPELVGSEFQRRKAEVQKRLNAKMNSKASRSDRIIPESQQLLEPKIEMDKAEDVAIVCNICGVACTTDSQLVLHKRTHWEQHPVKCNLCFQSFKDSVAMATHRKLHSANHQYECFVCGDEFTSEGTLQAHVDGHFGKKVSLEGGYYHNGFGMFVNALVNQGLQKHSEAKVWRCDQCPGMYATNQNLQKHKNSEHNGNQNPYQCEMCRKCFATVTQLLQHKRQDCRQQVGENCISAVSTGGEHVKIPASKVKNAIDLYSGGGKSRKNDRRLPKQPTRCVFSCELCSENFQLAEDLIQHKRSQHPVKTAAAASPQQQSGTPDAAAVVSGNPVKTEPRTSGYPGEEDDCATCDDIEKELKKEIKTELEFA